MNIKKSITFIYMESSEKAMYTPLYNEAKKRGYEVKMTDNKFEKCEIGFYCQHTNFPQFSKFSVIMLHDVIQQYGNWPDIWLREPWNKYDIGVLPSNQWVENWNQCSQWFYARPKKGMYKVGWPKADIINEIKNNSYREEFYNKYGLDLNKKTILYAPAWENDGKQDDFVKAVLPLGVNVVIKQYDASAEEFPDMVRCINEMYELHKDLPGVTILPPQTNIFNAIAVSDILVSEESSTMAEAIMMGVPAVSVSDWLIPDTTPSRYPKCDYDFVVKTTKNELSDCIKDMVDHYDYHKQEAIKACENNFANIGNASVMIMDIIDDCLNNKTIRYEEINASNNKKVPVKQYLKYLYFLAYKEISQNYRVRFKFFDHLWELLRKIKRLIKP